MLCSVAQLPGLWNDDSRMTGFHTIIYLLGLLVGNPAIYFVLILKGEALLMGAIWMGRRLEPDASGDADNFW